MKRIIAILLCFLLAGSLTISVCAVSSVPAPVMKATESVVRVLAEYADGYSTGSGFVIKSDKTETLIATNYHVVEDSTAIDVFFYDSQSTPVSAELVGYSEIDDIAVLKVNKKGLRAATFASSGTIEQISEQIKPADKA